MTTFGNDECQKTVLQGKGLECDWEVGGNLGMVVSEDFLEEVMV